MGENYSSFEWIPPDSFQLQLSRSLGRFQYYRSIYFDQLLFAGYRNGRRNAVARIESIALCIVGNGRGF